ncbi:kinase-like domain-containing protein [Rhizophagus clarus]|uniref:Kinase-like domain-containing protein n=1 Tax=Rhizophagus clarus TaxID=94130 RepID=A0A8H3LWG4_9GLOM|nr:kinase-like domain-containing protein [Rhizophagus clarus]
MAHSNNKVSSSAKESKARGFGIIYKAIWLSKYKEIVLKSLSNLDENNLNEKLADFLNEWDCHEKCLNSNRIIDLHGFTKDPDTSQYMIVMDYADKGDLNRNLTKVIKNNWGQRLLMLYEIISGLNEIHRQNLIHCDFHHDLMKKCWDEDPLKRPSASEVENIIKNWIYRPSSNEINDELKSNIMEFINAPIVNNDLTAELHPQACYISRLHDFTNEELNEILDESSEKLDEIVESECLNYTVIP